MYLDILSRLEPGAGTRSVANSDFVVYWQGLLFVPGIRAGLSSAQKLLGTLRSDDDLETLVKRTVALRGSWALIIHSLRDNSWVACADHSHQSYLCFSDRAVSSSFLRMRHDVPDKSRLSAEALAAFLCTGFCTGSTAFYEGLRILDYRDYVCVKKGELTVKSKGLPNVFERTRDADSFVDTIDSLFSSLRYEPMCVDLTGGTDSRSLVTCLNYLNYNFDIATEGDDVYSEVETAQAIGHLLGKNLKQRNMTSEDLAPRDLRQAWIGSDGLDFQLLSYKFETWRQQFGYSVAVSGFAGELYKDGGWYRAALASTLSRNRTIALIDRMIASGGLITWDAMPYSDVFSMLTPELGEQVRQWIRGVRAQLAAEYGCYPVREAADRIFFDFSTNRPAGTRLTWMPHYTPLTEPDLVRIGVNQPMMRRLNHRFYRQEVGRLDAPVAALPTDRGGLTMSSKLQDQPGQWLRYMHYYLSSKGIGRTPAFKSENRNKSAVDSFILASEDLKAAMAVLKDRGLVSTALDSPTVCQAKRLLMLHYLLADDDRSDYR